MTILFVDQIMSMATSLLVETEFTKRPHVRVDNRQTDMLFQTFKLSDDHSSMSPALDIE